MAITDSLGNKLYIIGQEILPISVFYASTYVLKPTQVNMSLVTMVIVSASLGQHVPFSSEGPAKCGA